MNLARLDNWVPLRLYARDRRAMVDWAHLGEERFTDPFFEQTIARCLQHPADILFRHQTPMETLRELYEQRRGLVPSGFIFHMSRCGSTLIAQMLAAIERNIVISEARPIDQVLGASMNESQRIDWFRWLLSALAQPRCGESNFFIKFDAWHTVQLPLILRAFPNVPWVFVYRNPVEVMVSLHRERGVQVMPGVLSPAMFGLDPHELWITRLDEYAARVLARICEVALVHRQQGHGRLVDFTELPNVVPDALLKFFNVNYSAEEMERLQAASQFDAKRPGLYFESDVAAKNRAATDELRRLTEQFLQPVYAQLEEARHAQDAG